MILPNMPVLCCLLLGLASVAFADPIVSIPNGELQGLQLQSPELNEFYAFLGVPYGQPPIGDLRFESPQPALPWNGTLDATQERDGCLPLSNYSFYPNPGPKSEDCLYLNIYTPQLNQSANLPVMFWIFGGGFVGGSKDYRYFGPQFLLVNDVIVVTINHRLGPFGFLSTADNVILGNMGLKDQNLALQWVQSNIKYFGGDPQKVTVFGESSGGQSTGLHILSKKSRGLFRAAICQSGCSITDGFQPDPKTYAYAVAQQIDETITEKNSSLELKNFLLKQPAETLVIAAKAVGTSGIRPVLEVEDDEAFLTQPFYALVEAGDINPVALIVGATSEEALGFIDEDQLAGVAEGYDEDWSTLVPRHLRPIEGSNLTEIGELIKNTYVGVNGTFADDLVATLEYYSDNINVKAAIKMAQLHSAFNPAYLFQFSFYGSKAQGHYNIEGGGKAGHFDDVPYVFNMTTYPLVTDADDLCRKQISRLWTNFAKTLNPTPAGDELLQNVIWSPVTPDNIQYLDIDDTLEVKPNRKVKEYATWNYVYDTYATKPIITF
ncbi:cocaine esterase-like isoform X2 [Cylas formicarius]|uniref:cocaine esterase-like isoform X2 n=1 Tax=Cylas formicarius TaxID=197179 RepID=UPI002958504B|nr:cocaine esterase-like isoform X2 [Cylas formicarius]